MSRAEFKPNDRVRLCANGLVGTVHEIGEPGAFCEDRTQWDILRGTHGYRKRYPELINTFNIKGD